MFVVLFTLEFTTAGEFSSGSPPEAFYGWLHHGGCIDTHELIILGGSWDSCLMVDLNWFEEYCTTCWMQNCGDSQIDVDLHIHLACPQVFSLLAYFFISVPLLFSVMTCFHHQLFSRK